MSDVADVCDSDSDDRIDVAIKSFLDTLSNDDTPTFDAIVKHLTRRNCSSIENMRRLVAASAHAIDSNRKIHGWHVRQSCTILPATARRAALEALLSSSEAKLGFGYGPVFYGWIDTFPSLVEAIRALFGSPSMDPARCLSSVTWHITNPRDAFLLAIDLSVEKWNIDNVLASCAAYIKVTGLDDEDSKTAVKNVLERLREHGESNGYIFILNNVVDRSNAIQSLVIEEAKAHIQSRTAGKTFLSLLEFMSAKTLFEIKRQADIMGEDFGGRKILRLVTNVADVCDSDSSDIDKAIESFLETLTKDTATFDVIVKHLTRRNCRSVANMRRLVAASAHALDSNGNIHGWHVRQACTILPAKIRRTELDALVVSLSKTGFGYGPVFYGWTDTFSSLVDAIRALFASRSMDPARCLSSVTWHNTNPRDAFQLAMDLSVEKWNVRNIIASCEAYIEVTGLNDLESKFAVHSVLTRVRDRGNDGDYKNVLKLVPDAVSKSTDWRDLQSYT
jgi:hypothetical protein